MKTNPIPTGVFVILVTSQYLSKLAHANSVSESNLVPPTKYWNTLPTENGQFRVIYKFSDPDKAWSRELETKLSPIFRNFTVKSSLIFGEENSELVSTWNLTTSKNIPKLVFMKCADWSAYEDFDENSSDDCFNANFGLDSEDKIFENQIVCINPFRRLCSSEKILKTAIYHVLGIGEKEKSRINLIYSRGKGTEISDSTFLNCKLTEKYQNSKCINIYTKPANGYGIITIKQLGTYAGQFKTHKFSGYGELIYNKRYNKVHKKARKSYSGFWRQGRQSGTGTMLWTTGASYKGAWVAGRRTGTGEFFSSHGNSFSGNWKNDKYHGFGEYFYSKSDSEKRVFYKGSWENNRKHGKGVMQWSEGNGMVFRKYEGSWKRNAKTGFGKMVYNNGDVYEGEWLRNKPHGKGEKRWKNGWNYKGYWLKGKRNGEGIFKGHHKAFYNGDWKMDKYHGQGFYNYAVNDLQGRKSYNGSWFHGKKHGNSCNLEWKNGTKYSGEFQNDKMSGIGTLEHASGEVIKGDFLNNKPEGQIEYQFSDNDTRSTYIGEWKSSEFNGFGALTNKDGKVLSGNFENGELEGNGSMIRQDGSHYEGYWKAGKFSEYGIFSYSENDEDGRQSYSGDWLMNRKHGFGELVWSNGQRYDGEWAHGYRKGNGTLYKPNGAIYDGEWLNDYIALEIAMFEIVSIFFTFSANCWVRKHT